MSSMLQGDKERITPSLPALKEKKRQLKLEIKVACGIIERPSQMVIGAERARRVRPLTCAEEFSIRSSAFNWQDRNYLDSLYIELEKVTKQIASLTPSANQD